MVDLTRLLKTSSEKDPESLRKLCKELVRRGYLEEDLFDPFPYLGGLIKGFHKNGKVIHLMRVVNTPTPLLTERSFCGCGWEASNHIVVVQHLSKICKICVRKVKAELAEQEALEASKKARVKITLAKDADSIRTLYGLGVRGNQHDD